jgi:hypothetical protein
MINETQARLEALGARLARLEAQQAAAATQGSVTVSDRPTDVPEQVKSREIDRHYVLLARRGGGYVICRSVP